MTGFVTGIAVVLGLSQLPTVTGVESAEGTTLSKALHVVSNPMSWRAFCEASP